ncbi:acyl-coenzyme A amino acid N-acyltransferase 1 isoform X2 [Aplysia californica]|uniref:Acyl-coenzyme A amino acid N-acyltransferase 1 isoform X2 n=1 Tax=Aplysia californica TaxID=6500 RepID=A0ABM1W0C1_APLCA|nr:acyl-coenzyme A amino acid N-acyltransferase 1 isoform X2 [Aplysia californica]
MKMEACSRRLYTLARHVVSGNGQQVYFSSDVNAGQSIRVEPRVALYDDKVDIALSGFSSHEKVTVHGQSVNGEKKILFGSCGQYIADENGFVDVTKQPSHGGTYTGVEPMGIVWSLQPAPGQPQQTRMAINFTNRPGLITLNTYAGHLDLTDIYGESGIQPSSLASIEIERWFRHEDVTRIEIEEGNVRGALFLPPGDGPFQGVIDMFGSSGGLIEYRAALLASRGFAALSLPYFKYKDLPANLLDQGFEYFEEAVNWFSKHPKIYQGGIGVIGVSKGAEYVLCMSAYCPQVTAAVSINGLFNMCIGDLKYKGEVLLKGSEIDLRDEYFTDDGLILTDAYPTRGDLIPIWKGKAKHLMLVSMDDGQVNPESYQVLYDACPEEKKKDIEIVRYPGAGHLLEPPYNALCRASVNRVFGVVMYWGGRPKEHAHAQEDSWQKTLEFLRENIPKTL